MRSWLLYVYVYLRPFVRANAPTYERVYNHVLQSDNIRFKIMYAVIVLTLFDIVTVYLYTAAEIIVAYVK